MSWRRRWNCRRGERHRPSRWETACGSDDPEEGCLGACGLWVVGVEFGDLDLFGEADLGEEPDAVVVDVELVPGEAVTRADRVGVVVIVPAFAAGEQGDPPGVAGVVLGFE